MLPCKLPCLNQFRITLPCGYKPKSNRIVKVEQGAILLSLLFHCLVFAWFIRIGNKALHRDQKQIVIDFTMAYPEVSVARIKNDVIPKSLTQHKYQQPTKLLPSPDKDKSQQNNFVKPALAPIDSNLVSSIIPAVISQTVRPLMTSDTLTAPVSSLHSDVSQADTLRTGEHFSPSKAASTTGTASASMSNRIAQEPENLKQLYLSKHFTYIRDLINQQLVYPRAARKMGWSGRVVLRFVVTTTGSVDSLRVVSSSGYQTLDRDAIETVKKAAPFPKPPVSAELALPVEYSLE